MSYAKIPPLHDLAEQLELYAQLKAERGAPSPAPVLKDAERALRSALKALKKLPEDAKLKAREPDKLAKIRSLRPVGPRRMWPGLDEAAYTSRLEGALLGRFAGCTLGAPVECWPVEAMQEWAREIGDAFPPTDYWSRVTRPHLLRYGKSRRDAYSRPRMNGVPVDDDIVYTLLGLLIVEDSGLDFTVDDVGRGWLKYLPYACTAEKVALANLGNGVAAGKAAERDNPYCEWIGADIRSDPWGYLAPGWPEMAADMAYRDACISHRRNGVYGEMYFSAVISAAFAVDDPVEALQIGLSEIPRNCTLARDIRWALKKAPQIKDYRQARQAVDARFKGMHRVHTNNNACLTIWGLTIGGTDFSRVISETVAMGLDNDCTAATAGSIAGALVGKKGIPSRWYRKYDGKVHSYLIGKPTFKIDSLIARFKRQAKRMLNLSNPEMS